MGNSVLSIRDFESSPAGICRFGASFLVRFLELFGNDRPHLRIPKLDIHAGKCYAVIGKSGAGKTVLNSLLLGLPSLRIGRGVRVGKMAWWDGGVQLRSSDFSGSSRLVSRWREVRRRGTLLYLPQILPDGRGYQMSVRVYLEQVLCALMRQAGGRVADVGDAFALFPKDLTRILGASVTSLSGGERRRIELWARLYILNKLPKERLALLILDEPTTGLDVPDERRYLEDLRKMMLDLPNLAVLVTTHALYFLDDCLPPGRVPLGHPRQPLFDQVILVHKEPESESGQAVHKNVPLCRVTSAVFSTRLCEAVRKRTPDKSVEDSMENFVEWQARLAGDEFSENVEQVYFRENEK